MVKSQPNEMTLEQALARIAELEAENKELKQADDLNLRDKLICSLASALYTQDGFFMDSRRQAGNTPFIQSGFELFEYVDGLMEARRIHYGKGQANE